MKRKQYIKPSMQVTVMNMTMCLCISGENIPYYGDQQNPDEEEEGD